MPQLYPAQLIDDVVVVSPIGRITIGSGDIKLRETVQHYLEEGWRRFVLDFANATAIDSNGAGALVSAYTTTTSRGGVIVLTRLTEKILDFLTITQLITVFSVYSDIESAVAATKLSPIPDFSKTTSGKT